jgi:hypothetical protein
MVINAEVANALAMMKYVLNHQWKFEYPTLGFIAGFAQMFSAILTAFISYNVIITAETVLELAKDFTALMIIAEIDNQFAEVSKEIIAKDAIEDQDGTYADLFKTETTSSKDAHGIGNEPLKECEIHNLLNEKIKYKNA